VILRLCLGDTSAVSGWYLGVGILGSGQVQNLSRLSLCVLFSWFGLGSRETRVSSLVLAAAFWVSGLVRFETNFSFAEVAGLLVWGTQRTSNFLRGCRAASSLKFKKMLLCLLPVCGAHCGRALHEQTLHSRRSKNGPEFFLFFWGLARKDTSFLGPRVLLLLLL
jgi:hypothetical protein